MGNEEMAYCPRCDKLVTPNGLECPICETTVQFDPGTSVVLPEAMPEPVMETEPEPPVEAEAEEVEVVAETDEVVDIEDLLAKG